MDQLSHFLELWFGHSDAAVDPADRVGPVMRFNHRAEPDWFDGDVKVLVVEQQGVWLWGGSKDGRHLERENEPGLPWRETGETTEEFWLHVAAFQAVSNLPASRSAQEFSPEAIGAIEQATQPLPCKAWTWPGTQQTIRYRGACVVMICNDGEDFWVVASAPAEADLDWLDELSLTWDESDTRCDLDH
jgi:hypothetical protein